MTPVRDLQQIGFGMMRLPRFDEDERRYVVLCTQQMHCSSAMNYFSDGEVSGGSADGRFEFLVNVKRGAVVFANWATTTAKHEACMLDR